jgi:hypothetical protein
MSITDYDYSRLEQAEAELAAVVNSALDTMQAEFPTMSRAQCREMLNRVMPDETEALRRTQAVLDLMVALRSPEKSAEDALSEAVPRDRTVNEQLDLAAAELKARRGMP